MLFGGYRKRLGDREPIMPSSSDSKFTFSGEKKENTISLYAPKISLTMDVISLTRNLKSEIINVSTISKRILIPPHPTCYYIINPSAILGLTTSIVLFDGTTDTAGNTQADALWVADYLNLHLHITVYSITGSWKFIQQSRDPYSSEWADVKTLATIDTPGAYYFNLGSEGICTDFALAWDPVVAGTISFSATATLKEEISGVPYGIGRAVFIGDRGVTPDTGIPILEGKGLKIYPEPDIEIWAIAYSDVDIQVFWL